MKKILITAIGLLLFILNVHSQLSQDDQLKIDSLFEQWDHADSPGAVLGIIQNGALIYTRGYGMADLEHDIPIDQHSVFYIGSVSKQFVTMCILLLEEQGKLDLDDEIQVHLPDFPRYDDPLTIRHFIHHTSGVRDYLTLWYLSGKDYMDYIDEDDVYALIKRQKTLNFTPGDRYLYSNSCYFMLAMIVEEASGVSIKEFARVNLFEPLGMVNSHFHDDYLHLIKNRVFSYSPNDEGDTYNNLIMRFDLVGSGGVYTNVEDLYLWDQNFYANTLGSGGQAIIEKMHEEGVLNNGESAGYAFALHNDTYRGLRTVSHGGSLAGYRSQLMRFPDHQFSVIVLANISNFKPTARAHEVADVLLASQFTEEAPAKLSQNQMSDSPATEAPPSYTAQELFKYAGNYYSDELNVFYDFIIRDNALILFINGKELFPLRVVKPNVFAQDRSGTISFEEDKTGEITGFSLDAGRVQNLQFERK